MTGMDWLCAEVPEEFIPRDKSLIVFYQECARIWDDVRAELTCVDYLRRTHARLSTYDAGCRGPLCRKARRERSVDRAIGMRAPREFREYDPILEYFDIVIRHRLLTFHRHLLAESVR